MLAYKAKELKETIEKGNVYREEKGLGLRLGATPTLNNGSRRINKDCLRDTDEKKENHIGAVPCEVREPKVSGKRKGVKWWFFFCS